MTATMQTQLNKCHTAYEAAFVPLFAGKVLLLVEINTLFATRT